MAGKFEMYKDKAGKYRFRLKASNGEIILSSQGYAFRSGCRNGIASVRKNSKHNERFSKLDSKGGKCRFNLMAANGHVIATSQGYASVTGRANGIRSVARTAGKAIVVDAK